MGNQHILFELGSTEQMFRDFQDIEKNKNIISSLLDNVDWVSELCLSHNDVNLSSELFLRKVEKLINFRAPLQKVSNKQKKLLKLVSAIFHQVFICHQMIALQKL